MKNKILLLCLSVFVAANINCAESKSQSQEIKLSANAQKFQKEVVENLRIKFDPVEFHNIDTDKIDENFLAYINLEIEKFEQRTNCIITSEERSCLISLAKHRFHHLTNLIIWGTLIGIGDYPDRMLDYDDDF